MNSNSYWSSHEDEILIKFVRNHEAIYNIKSKEYRKTELKQKLWREIGEILNKTNSDCFKRWCYIRDYYVRRRGKPGSSGEAAKKRSELLSFLDSYPSSQRNSTTSNVADENPELITCSNAYVATQPGDNSVIIETTFDYSERSQTPGDATIKIENTQNSEETQLSTQEIEDFVCYNNDHKKDDKVKRYKKRKHNAHGQELNKQSADRNLSQHGLDENDLFFGSIAKIVKKLPPYEQVQLRMQIGSLVGNAELRYISNNSMQGSALSYRPSTSNSD